MTRTWFGLLTVMTVGTAVLAAGCNRAYYRRQADDEAYALIEEKSDHPAWNLPDYDIQVDPRSRMFDPYNPDRPPMPPDDPVSHQFMHWVDQKRGYPHWHANGNTPFTQNPKYLDSLPLDEDGVLVLDGADAVRMALIHSPSYQENLETLYLSALDVSSERFRFDVQYYGGYGADYTLNYREGAGTTNNLDIGTRRGIGAPTRVGDWELQRAFTTGGQLAVGVANALVWDLSGSDASSTLINFSLLQPLLRGAGRDRVLETLTLSERTLLANVRAMERYRRGFYLDLMTGTGQQSGPQRRGGFLGGAGLAGFTGVGSGGFGNVGAGFFGGGGGGAAGGGLGGGGAGAGSAGGFIGLLQTQQIIRNREANIAALQSSLAQLEAFREAGRIDFFQVEQVRQQLFQELSQLLTVKRGYQDSLDDFKRDLGLPPYLPVEIEDPMLDQFKLIDVEIVPVQNRVTDLQRSVGQLIISLLPADEGGTFQYDERLRRGLEQLSTYIRQIEAARRQALDTNVPRVLEDVQRLRTAVPRRLESAEQLAELAKREREREQLPGEERLLGDVDDSLFETEGLEELPEELKQNVDEIVARFGQETQTANRVLENIEALLQSGEELTEEQLGATLRDNVFGALPALLTELSADILELSLIQARARAESAVLVPVDIDSADALEIARIYRLDWMNARASLVDAWRLIEFNADQLEGELQIRVDGSYGRVTTSTGFDLASDEAGNLRAAIQFDTPLTRLQERNTYRQALIEYQQARRSYYRFEDSVSTQLRGILRQVELNRVNFELRRVALRVAVAQVQSARLRLEEPPRAADLAAGGGALGPTTAQNLLSALASLRGAQDDFLSVWVNYEVNRALLDLQMGTMELDSEGLWLDPGPIGAEYNYPDLANDKGLCPWIWTKHGLAPRPLDQPETVPPGDVEEGNADEGDVPPEPEIPMPRDEDLLPGPAAADPASEARATIDAAPGARLRVARRPQRVISDEPNSPPAPVIVAPSETRAAVNSPAMQRERPTLEAAQLDRFITDQPPKSSREPSERRSARQDLPPPDFSVPVENSLRTYVTTP